MSITPSTAIDNVKKSSLSVSNGNTLYVGGSGPNNYTKIQDAIDNATDGDTVFVYNGMYYENVLVDKIIDLIGEFNDTTIIDGLKVGTVVTVIAHQVNISGFTIRNSGTNTNNVGILIGSNFNTIENNIISDNYHYGIDLYNAHNNIIHNNLIYSTYADGVYIGDSNNNNFSSNIIINNGRWGIQVYFSSSNNKFINNKICNNDGEGISLWVTSENNYIAGNNISSNGGSGILIFDYSSHNIITRNLISNNFFGIYICYYANHNIISQNNFINNKIDSYFRMNWINKNRYYENYWGRSRFLPKPIFGAIGPVLALIPWVKFDWHPAKEPYDITTGE